MHPRHVGRKLAEGRKLAGRLSLTQQVALLSLVPVVALGFVLARVLQSQIVARTLADASQSAELIAHIGVQPRLSQRALREGLSTHGPFVVAHERL
jgi:hypothetical protein